MCELAIRHADQRLLTFDFSERGIAGSLRHHSSEAQLAQTPTLLLAVELVRASRRGMSLPGEHGIAGAQSRPHCSRKHLDESADATDHQECLCER